MSDRNTNQSTSYWIFGSRLREARDRRMMTRAFLAARAGVSVSSIDKYEDGTALPTVENLQKLSRVLGTSADWLVDLVPEDPARPIGPECESLIKRYNDLSDEQRQTVADLVGVMADRRSGDTA